MDFEEQTKSISTAPRSSPINNSEHPKLNRRSMFYSSLYALAQKRMPFGVSRPVSDLKLGGQELGGSTCTESNEPATPPPEYSSRPHSRHVSTAGDFKVSTEEVNIFGPNCKLPGVSRSQQSPSQSARDDEGGINWKFASQGINLLAVASQESTSSASSGPDSSAALSRQLYLHGISHLLRGIPSDLTQEELLSLRAAVPASIGMQPNASMASAADVSSLQAALILNAPNRDASVLQRITASIVFHAFILIQFLLPYVKLCIGRAYRWECEHKITQRMVSKSLTTVDSFGRRSLQLSRAVCQMNDGKVGQAINDATVWWVQGLAGGIQQGISDGVSAAANETIQTSERRIKNVD